MKQFNIYYQDFIVLKSYYTILHRVPKVKVERGLQNSYNTNDFFVNANGLLENIFSDIVLNVEKDSEKYIIDNIDLITDLLKKVIGNYTIQDSNVLDNINTICKLFNLPDSAKDILSVYVSAGKLCYFYRFLIDTDPTQIISNSTIDKISFILDISNKEMKNTISLLRDYGVLSNNFSEITNAYLDIITSDKEVSIESLIGEEYACNTSWDNFDYIKNKDLIKKIVNQSVKKKKKCCNILFYGMEGTGKSEFAKVLAKELKAKAYFLERKEKSNKEERINLTNSALHLASIIKDKSILVVDEADEILSFNIASEQDRNKLFFNRFLENNKKTIIWICNNINSIEKSVLRRMDYIEKFDGLDKNYIKSILEKESDVLKIEQDEINKISEHKLPIATLVDSISLTKSVKGDSKSLVTIIGNKSEALRLSKQKVNKEVHPSVTPNYDLSYVNSNTNISLILEGIKSKNILNFSMCLYGLSGTGKSEFAFYIAKELGLPVVRKKLHELVSCWVGETEMLIANSFKEAKERKAVLIFDEADSYLRDRTLSKNSWEVTQTNEMLVQMEEHEYPFICTTNLYDTLDTACLRRFTFKILFKALTQDQFLKVFQKYFNQSIPDSYCLKKSTLGDFKTVQNKLNFLGNLSNFEILELLKEEQNSRNINSSDIGFI